MELTTTKGRRVHFEQLRIDDSDAEAVYVKPGLDSILKREYALMHLQSAFKTKFPQYGRVMLDPPPDRLPKYTLYGRFSSKTAVKEGDCSFLVAAWFADELPTDIPGTLQGVLNRVDWDKSAVDGNSADE
jgi:hypothetical protein